MVWTEARLERSPLRSVRGPVDSPHAAAVSASTMQVISLMRLDLHLPLPRQPGSRHSGLANAYAPIGNGELGERRRSESNRRIEVLQTSALPLGYGARASKVTKSPGFLNPANLPSARPRVRALADPPPEDARCLSSVARRDARAPSPGDAFPPPSPRPFAPVHPRHD